MTINDEALKGRPKNPPHPQKKNPKNHSRKNGMANFSFFYFAPSGLHIFLCSLYPGRRDSLGLRLGRAVGALRHVISLHVFFSTHTVFI
jgi:hypothetical protein